MRTTQDYDVRGSAGTGRAYDIESSGVGWVVFAAVMLAFTGLWNLFEGIAAISSAHVFVANANFVFSDLNSWGWIVLCLGILQGVAALTLLSGSELARWFGIACASVNAIGQLMFAPAYPWWSIAMFSIDILVIYALAAYGGAKLRQG